MTTPARTTGLAIADATARAAQGLYPTRSLWLITSLDIRSRANSRLRSAPSVNPACAAARGATERAVLASAPLAGFGD